MSCDMDDIIEAFYDQVKEDFEAKDVSLTTVADWQDVPANNVPFANILLLSSGRSPLRSFGSP